MNGGAPGEKRGLGEFDRIRRFFAPLAGTGSLGLTDDAALVADRPGRSLVITTDAIVAGVHFLADDPPELIARKLLRVNLSDLAAMGAVPRHYLLTTALPGDIGDDWLSRFADGLGQDQRQFAIELLGGDSVATSGPIVLSLTAIGEVATGTEIRRSGARGGDRIWVSGTIGDAALGLAVLRGKHPELEAESREYLIRRYRLPEPRCELGPRLVGVATAMLDVSDGLIADLDHICENSHLGAVISAASLPLSPTARALAAADPALVPALATGGDDYELVFTAAPGSTEIINGLSASLGVRITQIGRIEDGEGARLVDGNGSEISIGTKGYAHF